MIRKLLALAIPVMLCVACSNLSDKSSNDNLNRHIAKNDQQLNGEPADKLTSEDEYELTDSIIAPQQLPNEKKQQIPDPILKVDWDKKIVKTATLNAEIKDYKTFSQQLSEKVKKYGGYISQEEQTQSDYKIENTVVIKVPVDQFESAINDLIRDASKINEKRITSEDVTRQLVDGNSRLEAKKQVRLRYLDLLKQAKNMEEILTVQNEINEIQEEIETVNGRINLLRHSSSLSTIHYSYYQVLDASAKGNSPDDETYLTKVKTAFATGWYWIGEIFVGLLSIWPLLIMIILGIILYRKKQMPKIQAGSNPS